MRKFSTKKHNEAFVYLLNDDGDDHDDDELDRGGARPRPLGGDSGDSGGGGGPARRTAATTQSVSASARMFQLANDEESVRQMNARDAYFKRRRDLSQSSACREQQPRFSDGDVMDDQQQQQQQQQQLQQTSTKLFFFSTSLVGLYVLFRLMGRPHI